MIEANQSLRPSPARTRRLSRAGNRLTASITAKARVEQLAPVTDRGHPDADQVFGS
jgi:hypothetical protein